MTVQALVAGYFVSQGMAVGTVRQPLHMRMHGSQLPGTDLSGCDRQVTGNQCEK